MSRPRKIDAISILESLSSLLGIRSGKIPFRAQNRILQAIQQHLEFHAFWFAHKWLPVKSLMNRWTCPEELELHRFFIFLARNKTRVQHSAFRQASRALLRMKGPVSAIRHAAVHRLSQDRESLLQMNRVAIEFVMITGESSSPAKLCRLLDFLEARLPKSDRLAKPSPFPERPLKSKSFLRRRRYIKTKAPLTPLPKSTIEVVQWVEGYFVLEVERFLHAVFL
ncbi:hypothetical protein N7520_001594 [Penicillium odoratum]|uniref:uncharacterized protein n=1 Tax=Penicillium odoratum TaxID=1167516 RepID=UPI0025490372|nr:uncharacterized protein N7520_001594 [Penicillium odoratum]KAJ5778348.1 hypothetical protein N7520_001594 [Penicillium odoratum]